MPTRRPERDDATRRLNDAGFIFGIIGVIALTWVVASSTAPQSGCCEQLQRRDVELLICETRLNR